MVHFEFDYVWSNGLNFVSMNQNHELDRKKGRKPEDYLMSIVYLYASYHITYCVYSYHVMSHHLMNLEKKKKKRIQLQRRKKTKNKKKIKILQRKSQKPNQNNDNVMPIDHQNMFLRDVYPPKQKRQEIM